MQHEQIIHKSPAGTGPLKQAYPDLIELAAHDLQAPLRKLGVFTERLINKYIPLPDQEAGQYIKRIHTCLNQMKSLIDDLAGYSAATPEKMVYTICEPGPMIRKLTAELVSVEEVGQVEIRMTELPVINGDKAQLELVFKKILENSFRFRKPGVPLTIEINATELSPSERMVLDLPAKKFYELSFADNGIGFSEGDSKKIFEPLVRLHGRSEFAGNGLGLAWVKRIIENHGGIAYAEGNRAIGARIILVIPENGD